MSASQDLRTKRQSRLLLEIAIALGSLAGSLTILWLLRTRLMLPWHLMIAYGVLVSAGVLGLIHRRPQKSPPDNEAQAGQDLRVHSICFLVAVLVQLTLKFYWDFSWLWSLVIGLAVFFATGLIAGLLRGAGASLSKIDPTWAFGNLPPLVLQSRTAGRYPSGNSGKPMAQDPRDLLSVHINKQAFSVGDPFRADTLFLANFEEGGSVARVRAGSLPDQTLLVAKHCAAKSFGGEFIVAPLGRGKGPSPVMEDVTAFLFFNKPALARLPGPCKLERIIVVAAGGEMILNTVTENFVKLASEMYGEPRRGSRGQRIWPAGNLFLVCEEETWKTLRRTIFIWTIEALEIREAG